MTDAKTRIAAFDRATFELVHAEHGIEWRPHGFRGPIKYAVLTCTQCNRSLVIVDDDEGADSMARKKTDAEKTHEAQDAQPPLIKMSREELEEAGQSLAGKISELEELEASHKASREGQSAERKKVKGEIAAIASTIRNQGR